MSLTKQERQWYNKFKKICNEMPSSLEVVMRINGQMEVQERGEFLRYWEEQIERGGTADLDKGTGIGLGASFKAKGFYGVDR